MFYSSSCPSFSVHRSYPLCSTELLCIELAVFHWLCLGIAYFCGVSALLASSYSVCRQMVVSVYCVCLCSSLLSFFCFISLSSYFAHDTSCIVHLQLSRVEYSVEVARAEPSRAGAGCAVLCCGVQSCFFLFSPFPSSLCCRVPLCERAGVIVSESASASALIYLNSLDPDMSGSIGKQR